MSISINYDFVPDYKLEAEKYRKSVTSYAGKLLEVVGARSVVVGLDDDDNIYVLSSESRLKNPLDFDLGDDFEEF